MPTSGTKGIDALPAKLKELLEQKRIQSLEIDSRQVTPGAVYAAFQGSRSNAEAFIPQAIAKGALAVIARKDYSRPDDIPEDLLIRCDRPRALMANLAAQFYAPHPQHCLAVTGTNGKTSVCEFVRQMLEASGCKAASIGTLGLVSATDSRASAITTPDVLTFHQELQKYATSGIDHVIYEASSHGLQQLRSDGQPVEVAAFTNLSRDHLDYHGTIEAYTQAKLRLFSDLLAPTGCAVLWADDPVNLVMGQAAKKRGISLFHVGTEKAEQKTDLTMLSSQIFPTGQALRIDYQGQQYDFDLPLIGAYQASNILVALGIVLALDVTTLPKLLDAITDIQGVRGRLDQACQLANGVPVLVDYAHSPDGLESALQAVRPHAPGRIILVFGCGGDRDMGKRPMMGTIARKLADHTIVTDDNPRNEDPAQIRAQVRTHHPGSQEIADRKDAIAEAMRIATKGDLILIAGKGHEEVQIIAGVEHPFSDRTTAQDIAASMKN